jgi:2-amino-4-hydroxy-6-hydroxymethyldihydropteridine diphosphokinase
MQDADANRTHARESSDRFGRDGLAERRVRAYIGLGANVGDPERTLAEAVHALAALPGVRLRGVSRLYATEPVGVTDQPEFRNAVAALDVPGKPDPETGALDVLTALKELERAFGRRRRRRWGPRELDLDLLVFGKARVRLERPAAARSLDAETDPMKAAQLLEVPHPAAADRLFVLAPLADLAPGLVPPGWHETVETVRRRRALAEGQDAVRPVGTWSTTLGRWQRTAEAAQPR